MGIPDNSKNITKRIADGGHHDVPADILRPGNHGGTQRNQLPDSSFHVRHTPISYRPDRRFRRDRRRKWIQSQFIPADIETHIKRFVKIGPNSEHFRIPRFDFLQIGRGIDHRTQSHKEIGRGNPGIHDVSPLNRNQAAFNGSVHPVHALHDASITSKFTELADWTGLRQLAGMTPVSHLLPLLPALLSCGILTSCSQAESPANPAALVADPPPASGWKVELLSANWTASGFEGNEDLSGIASLDGTHCLLGSDELAAAQAGTIDRKAMTITAGALVPLIENPSGKKMEIDIESVAVSRKDNCYFVTGSHGTGKKKGEFDPTRASVFRIPCDPATGEPEKDGIQRASLLPWLEKSAEFKNFVRQPLQLNGFNIEGLTYSDGKLWFGVRGPNVLGNTYVIETTPESLFGRGVPECKAHALPVGQARGIRELAAVRDGFIILTGNASAEASKKFPTSQARLPDNSFDLFLWRPGQTPETQSIGTLPLPAAKAEAILVLEDGEKYVDILVLFDGEKEGAPRSYRLTRQ